MTNREWLSRLSNKELEEWLCDEMYDDEYEHDCMFDGPLSITADDVKKFSEDLWKGRMIDEKTEIKDKLLNIFQKNYCMICGSQRCAGDLREGCSYYRSYIDKIKEVYDDIKGEIE